VPIPKSILHKEIFRHFWKIPKNNLKLKKIALGHPISNPNAKKMWSLSRFWQK
jgi:hypothetical protein